MRRLEQRGAVAFVMIRLAQVTGQFLGLAG